MKFLKSALLLLVMAVITHSVNADSYQIGATEVSNEPRRELRRGGGGGGRSSGGRSSYSSSSSSYRSSSSRSYSSFRFNFGYRTYGTYYSYAYYGNMYNPSCFPEDLECKAAVAKQRSASTAFLVVFIIAVLTIFVCVVCCCCFAKKKTTTSSAAFTHNIDFIRDHHSSSDAEYTVHHQEVTVHQHDVSHV